MMLIESTDATAVADLVRLVVTVYLTVAIMGIGFATMFAGSSGASAAAQFFFMRPLGLLVGGALALVSAMFGRMWSGLAALIGMLGRTVQRELREQAADFRWLVRRFDR